MAGRPRNGSIVRGLEVGNDTLGEREPVPTLLMTSKSLLQHDAIPAPNSSQHPDHQDLLLQEQLLPTPPASAGATPSSMRRRRKEPPSSSLLMMTMNVWSATSNANANSAMNYASSASSLPPTPTAAPQSGNLMMMDPWDSLSDTCDDDDMDRMSLDEMTTASSGSSDPLQQQQNSYPSSLQFHHHHSNSHLTSSHGGRPQPPQHSLQSVLNLDSPHTARDFSACTDPADARVCNVSHMFLSSNNAEVVGNGSGSGGSATTNDSMSSSRMGSLTAAPGTTKRSSWVTRSPAAAQQVPQDKHMEIVSDDMEAIELTCPDATISLVRTSSGRSVRSRPSSVTKGKKSHPRIPSHLPPELLLQIFSHFDPSPSRDPTAFLAPTTTTAALQSCALVCRWWNRVATRVLWRRPQVYDAQKFEKLVNVVANSTGSQHPPTTFAYASLTHHLSLSQTLSETHRHTPRLSSLLTRFLSLPTLHLSTLDLAFCKGVSNFALQRCAHSLRHLTSLNLAGGGRSEICIIKVARECRGLKRLGLAWNDQVGDFCVREVGRWCRELEWLDLSGCWRVGDGGVQGLVRGLASSSTIPYSTSGIKLCSSSLQTQQSSSSNTTTTKMEITPPLVPSNAPPLPNSRLTSHSTSPPTPPATPPSMTPSYSSSSSSSSSSSPHHTPKLAYLSLSYCTNITDPALQDLIAKLTPSLQVLNVLSCGDPGGHIRQQIEDAQHAGHSVAVSGGTLVPISSLLQQQQPPQTSSSSVVDQDFMRVEDHHHHHRQQQDKSSRNLIFNVPDFIPFWDGIRT
ncbi:hypothetical protein DFS34DRAFT_683989 [Phlyctochytrium arcticum]|nr:hypothetical protein DFS34DRAFT_683989 [Phlyctochytrium arcticum]